MSKNELVVVHLVHTLYGGVASVAATLMNEQYKHGILPIVAYVVDDPALESMLKFEVKKVKVNMKNYPGYSMLFGMGISRIYDDIKKQYPNAKIMIHAHNVQTVGLLSDLKNTPLVCTLHSLRGMDDGGIRPYISDMLYQKILNRIVKNQGCLASVSRAIAEYYNKNKLEVRVIHNGIDDNNFARDEHKKFTVAHIGNLSIAKGWDVTCEGFSKVNPVIRQNMQFVSAGRLNTYSAEEVERIFREKNIENEASYLGFINNAAKELMPRIDVLVLASKNEGLGLVLIEAMSQGIPVLATSTGGIKEIVKDEYNGFFIENPKDIAERLEQLYRDKKLYEKMSKNARITFEEEFTAEKMYEKYQKLYLKQYERIR